MEIPSDRPCMRDASPGRRTLGRIREDARQGKRIGHGGAKGGKRAQLTGVLSKEKTSKPLRWL
jgi:hypothetical protein